MASAIISSTDPSVDRWLRCHRPRTELALRYSIRGQFAAVENNATFSARIDELFAAMGPSEGEYAAILHDARAIGSAVAQLFNS
jgi:hypothetical protein